MDGKINFDDLVPKLDDDAFNQELPTVEETAASDQPTENVNKTNEVDDNVIEETSTDAQTDSAEETNDTDPQENVPEPDEAATLFYQELVNNGIVQAEEGKEEYSWEDVSSVINNYKQELPKQIAEEIINSAPDLGKDLIDYVFSKGNDLSAKDLNQFMSQYLTDLNDINTEFKEVDQARNYLQSQYKAQGIRDTQIEVMLDALEDEGEEAVFEEANKYKTKNAENSKSKQMLNETKQSLQERQQAQEQFANSLMQELQNTKWKPQRIQKVQQDLVSGRTNELLSKASSHPKALIQLANLATYFDEQSGEFKFDDFIKQVVSPEAKSLKDKITKDMFSTGTNTKERASNPNRSKYSDLVPISPIK